MDQINKDVSWSDLGLSKRAAGSQFPMFKWNDENIEVLKQLTDRGRSAAEIAREIGTTRNAVCGKWMRLGIVVPKSTRAPVSADERRARHARDERNRYKREREKERQRLLDLFSDPAAVVPLNIPFLDLEPGQCKFPYGESNFVFCGHPKMQDSSYCRDHHKLSYQVGR